MKLLKLALAASLFAVTTAGAHEATGQHGGRVTDAGDFHVELVAMGDTVDVFISDGKEKPVSVVGFKGIVVLVIDGKAARIPVEPADGNRLSGKASVALNESAKGVIQLTGPTGATASGKFN